MATAIIIRIVLSAYVLCFIVVNVIALFISSFYRKKFNYPSPQVGFLIALLFAVLYIVCLFVQFGIERTQSTLLVISVFCSSLASAASALSLYLTMRRIRK
jgi:hypothetical protein